VSAAEPSPASLSPSTVPASSLDLYWIPLGAGARVVKTSGRLYESLVAARDRRPRRDLYHSALVATAAGRSLAIEVAPIPAGGRADERGVVGVGAVGSRLLRPLRIFRYEVRCWPDGVIPDLHYAVASPVRITDEPTAVVRALETLRGVPTPVWGRDELRAGEMWNCNSVVSWTLTCAGLVDAVGAPPANGRAPGWDAGVRVATGNRL
jgi:hypothetical protein